MTDTFQQNKTATSVRPAQPTEEETQNLIDFLEELEDKLFNQDFLDFSLSDWLLQNHPKISGSWRRVVQAGKVAIDSPSPIGHKLIAVRMDYELSSQTAPIVVLVFDEAIEQYFYLFHLDNLSAIYEIAHNLSRYIGETIQTFDHFDSAPGDRCTIVFENGEIQQFGYI